MDKQQLLLYAITDCDNLQGEALLERTEMILANGATILQYRDKHGKARADVRALQALCKKYEVPIAGDSDSHICYRVGHVEGALEMLEEVGFPEELVINFDLNRLPYVLRTRHALEVAAMSRGEKSGE